MIQLIKNKYPAIGQTFRGFNPATSVYGGSRPFVNDTFETFSPAGNFVPASNFVPVDDFSPVGTRSPFIPRTFTDEPIFIPGRPGPGLVGAPPPSIPTPVISGPTFPTGVNPFPDPIGGFTPFDPNEPFIPNAEPPFRGPGMRSPIPNRFAQQAVTGIGTFSRFNMSEDVLQQQTEIVTGGVWSSGDASLTTFFSSSAQTTSQRRYYVEVYDDIPSAEGSAAQFSLAYGHAFGSGSDSQGQLNDSPSRAIYSQYRNLLLTPGTSRFTTYGSGSTNSIYALSFNRNRLKERLDPGNFEIPLALISGSRPVNATGSVAISSSNVVFTLIDDSSINTGSFTATGGRVYNIVSGSITAGVHNPSAPIYYGVSYPDYGAVILDGNVLDQKLNFQTGQATSIEANNHFALFRSISGSGTLTNTTTTDNFGFLARNSEKITSTHFFVRIKNGQFNYTNNPTFVTGSNGDVLTSFLTDPVTYITTIGLYNDQQELLAIAKVSQPILKSFSRESLIRVKLDF